MNIYIIALVSFTITAISSQFQNEILPMIMQPTINGIGIPTIGATLYGFPFPFLAQYGGYQIMEWFGLIIDIIIIALIMWGIVSCVEMAIRRYR